MARGMHMAGGPPPGDSLATLAADVALDGASYAMRRGLPAGTDPERAKADDVYRRVRALALSASERQRRPPAADPVLSPVPVAELGSGWVKRAPELKRQRRDLF